MRAAESLGANNTQVFLRVRLPASMPMVFTGLTLALGNAVSLIVAAELGGAFEGVGRMMFFAREVFRTDIVILGMFILMIMGTAAMGLMYAIRSYVLRWYLGEVQKE